MACASAHTKVLCPSVCLSVGVHVGRNLGPWLERVRSIPTISRGFARLSREGESCGEGGGVETLLPVEKERPEGRLGPEKGPGASLEQGKQSQGELCIHGS